MSKPEVDEPKCTEDIGVVRAVVIVDVVLDDVNE